MWEDKQWCEMDGEERELVGAARGTGRCRRSDYSMSRREEKGEGVNQSVKLSYWNKSAIIVVMRGLEGDCGGAFASGEETQR